MDDFKGDGPGRNRGLSRRSFLRVSGMVGATTFANGFSFPALAQKSAKPFSKGRVSGRRKFGSLEVSSVGLGCQDFTGTFYATAPQPGRYDHPGSHRS